MIDYHKFSKIHLQEDKPNNFFIKDPIHGEINFCKEQYWLYQLINSYEFQRLGEIRQMLFTTKNFPTSQQTRLVHCLGVYELANRFIKHFVEIGDLDREKNKQEINIALSAALLHDIGHGALSHVLEMLNSEFNHEKMGLRIIQDRRMKVNLILRNKALEEGLEENFYVNEICKVFNKESSHRWIMDMINSYWDIDKLDYMIRDSYFSGVKYGGAVDLNLLIKWSVLKVDPKNEEEGKRFLFLIKAKKQLEHFCLSRYHLYDDLYKNKVSEFYEYLLERVFSYLRKDISKWSKYESFQNIKFILSPVDSWDLDDFLRLKDFQLLHYLERFLDEVDDEQLIEYRGFLFGYLNDKSISYCMKKYGMEAIYKSRKDEIFKFWDNHSNSVIQETLRMGFFQ